MNEQQIHRDTSNERTSGVSTNVEAPTMMNSSRGNQKTGNPIREKSARKQADRRRLREVCSFGNEQEWIRGQYN